MEEKQDNVGAKHGAYDAVQKQRVVYQDVIAGTQRIRDKKADYMKRFPKESNASWDLRVGTATLFNLTKKTRDIMTGLVFQDPIELQPDIDADIVTLWENIDNQGTHGDVFCRQMFERSFEGYAAILVDAPAIKTEDAEQEQNLGIRPYWVLYTADQIWNWRYRVNPVSKKKELSLMVLREVALEQVGKFLSKSVVRFRVYNLDLNGVITLEVWLEKREGPNDSQPTYVQEGKTTVINSKQIPIGIMREIGEMPILQDVALKNLEHIQTYSDYKSIIHKTCVPIPVRTGYQQPEGSPALTNSGDMLIDIPIGGKFDYAEVKGTSIESVRQSLLDMREDISLMGLSILADKTAKVDLTATEALLNNIGETAELRVMARSAQDCIELCLGFTAEFLGLDAVKGGSVVMGTAWNRAEKAAEEAKLAAAQPIGATA